jgi:hypothetical protein
MSFKLGNMLVILSPFSLFTISDCIRCECYIVWGV